MTSTYFSIFILLSMIHYQTACPTNSHVSVSLTGKITCMKNPIGCLIVSDSPGEPKNCIICSESFFLKNKKECHPCFENCKICSGPNIKDCNQIKEGFSFNRKSKLVEKCHDETCSLCNENEECLSCKPGYYQSQKDGTLTNSLQSLKCNKCEIDNCLYCSRGIDQIANNTFSFCMICENQYTRVSGRCEACPQNCSICAENSKECYACNAGMQIEAITGVCIPILVPFCTYAQNATDCLYCEHGFYLSHGKCEYCQELQKNCDLCVNVEGSTDQEVKCIVCKNGFTLTDGTCLSCPNNCSTCTSDECFFCADAFFLNADSGNCKECRVDHCETCESSDACKTCRDGFYLKPITKTCEK